jgi:WD40 repeat protein
MYPVEDAAQEDEPNLHIAQFTLQQAETHPPSSEHFFSYFTLDHDDLFLAGSAFHLVLFNSKGERLQGYKMRGCTTTMCSVPGGRVATAGIYRNALLFEVKRGAREERAGAGNDEGGREGREEEEAEREGKRRPTEFNLVGELSRPLAIISELCSLECVYEQEKKIIVVGGDDSGTMWIWDIAGEVGGGEERMEEGGSGVPVWQALKSLPVNDDPMFTIVRLPGPFFATGALSKIRIWNSETFECLQEINLSVVGDCMAMCSLQTSSPSILLAVSVLDVNNHVLVLEGNPNNLSQIHSTELKGTMYESLEVIPGTLLLVGAGKEIFFWNFRENTKIVVRDKEFLSRNGAKRLSSGNILIGNNLSFQILYPYRKVWEKIGIWVSLAMADPGSVFSRIPIEIYFNFVGVAWDRLNFLNF